MVKYIILLLCSIFVYSCGQQLYKIEKDQYGEPMLNDKAQYSFTKIPSKDDLKKIDTTAYYVQIFPSDYNREEITSNPGILIFHKDGFFKREGLKYFGKFDKERKKNSIWYGGKYIINGKNILLESFYILSPNSKLYSREIDEGEIIGDKIIFHGPNIKDVFEKKKSIEQIKQ